MSTSLAALTAIAAIAITYFTCIRPMRRGTGSAEAELDRQIASLREEVRVLRAKDDSD